MDTKELYTKLIAILDIMRPDLEYMGHHENANPVVALALGKYMGIIRTLQEELGIDRDHPDFWEWHESDVWTARIMEGLTSPGSDYDLHRAYIKERHGIDLPERE